MNRSLAWVLLTALLVTGLASCSDASKNKPAPPVDKLPGTAAPTTAAKSGGGDGGDGPLAGVNPCSLLSKDEQARFGLGAGKARPMGMAKARGCQWKSTTRQEEGNGVTYLNFFNVMILDRAGINDKDNVIDYVGLLKIQKLPNIGSHQAVKHIEGGGKGYCSIFLGVTDSSRVDTSVTSGLNTARACKFVTELARAVEPNLP